MNMERKYFLSIGIPTYNRVSDLYKNLLLLEKQIISNRLQDLVYIIVSDNGSSDNTAEVLELFKKRSDVYIEIILQEVNKGSLHNTLAVTKASKAEYVCILGDDDYLNDDYIFNVIWSLREYPQLSCIIPNNIGVTPNGQVLYVRDKSYISKYYKKGYKTCLAVSWMAHQISGIVVKNGNVFTECEKRGVNNLYVQIFFVSYSILNGDCLYLANYPVKVTQIPQSQKSWSYGKDALIVDNFDNYINLNLTIFEVARLENCILRKSANGIMNYQTLYEKLRCMWIIIFSNKTVWPTKIYCLFFFPSIFLRKFASYIKKYLYSNE